MTALLHGAANLTSAELAAAVGPFDGYDENREPMLRVMQMHRDAVDRSTPACPAYLQGRGPRTCGTRCSTTAGSYGYPQRPGHGAGADRHDQLHDGLRHDRHRARHRPGEVQATGRRRHAEDRQPTRCRSALKTLGYDQPQIESILAYIDKRRHDRRRRRPEGRAPAASSTVPSSRATARVRSPGRPTCR